MQFFREYISFTLYPSRRQRYFVQLLETTDGRVGKIRHGTLETDVYTNLIDIYMYYLVVDNFVLQAAVACVLCISAQLHLR